MNGSSNTMNNALVVAAAAAAQLNLNYQTQGGCNSGIVSGLVNMTATLGQGTQAESCIFCNKPLANLNEFNKKMHLENCKIRKSIEGVCVFVVYINITKKNR